MQFTSPLVIYHHATDLKRSSIKNDVQDRSNNSGEGNLSEMAHMDVNKLFMSTKALQQSVTYLILINFGQVINNLHEYKIIFLLT